MKCPTALLTLPLLFAAPAMAADAQPRPDQLAFRDIYKELVETDTTLSAEAAPSRPSVWRRG